MTEQTSTPNPSAGTTEAPAPQPAPPYAGYGATAPGPKRLTRTPGDKMIAGVCGGIARYFDIDPTLVRVGAVITLFLGFPAVLLGYLVAWLIVPKG